MEKGPVFVLSIGDLLTIYDPDSQSWKMSECLFTGDFARYSEALPKSGIMLNGRIYAQATWVLRTGGKESGLWRTPAAHDPGVSPERLEPIEGGELGGMNRHFDRHTGRMAQIGLTQQVALRNFPTPQASDGQQGAIMNENTKIIFLKSGKPRKISNQGVSGSVGLSRYAQIMWRTPDTCAGGTKSKAQYEKAKKTGCNAIRLQDQVKHEISWSTPRSRDWKGKSQRGADPENRDCLPNAAGGQLNPQFVEWLMGYPLNYTDTRDDLRLSLIRE
jgi:hypothetical protein